MGYEALTYDTSDGMCTITMNRPDRLNAIDAVLAGDLARALREAASNGDARCVVLTGAGRGFCAGLDLSQLGTGYTETSAGDILRHRYNPIVTAIVEMEKPVVASVNGVAAGAGASLAMACDFRIASDEARFLEAFIRIALVPDSGATYFLPRLIGYAKALEMAMLGEAVGAEDALRLGLVTRVVPAAALAEETRAFAERLAAGPTRAYGLTRKALLFAVNADLRAALDYEADLQSDLALRPDFAEGVAAFQEKRTPNFTGR